MTDTPPLNDGPALTRFLEARYHMRHREQLPVLAVMAAKVELAHAGHPNVPSGLAPLLRRLDAELTLHMRKEELILFPAIRAGEGTAMAQPIAVMRSDHADHERALEAVLRITGDLELPADACATWTRLYVDLKEFMSDFSEHLRLENDVLFPMFEPTQQ